MTPHAECLSQEDTIGVAEISHLPIYDFNQRNQPMELMFDLETLDITSQSIVLSVGAVAFQYVPYATPTFDDSFYRVLEIDCQVRAGRTVSQSTILWWMAQDKTARDFAFDPHRSHTSKVLIDLNTFVGQYVDGSEIKKFWAGPATFDFPIWESLAQNFTLPVPWKYNQMRDLTTIVDESGISVDKVDAENFLTGVLHHPVYDCERQIHLLAAARNALKR